MYAFRFFSFLAVCLFYSGCVTLHETPNADDAKQSAALAEKESDTSDTDADEKGLTPLIQAARANQTETIAMLLEKGANPEEKDKEGKTAIIRAYETGSFASFRLLLEKGAVFKADQISAEDAHKKKHFADLAAEYRMYQNLTARGEETPALEFETYFLQFPGGNYATAVKTLFKAMVQKDFSRIGNPPDQDRLQAFIRKYADMGKHCCRITADFLNIRKTPSASAPCAGRYSKEDRVCALEENEKWIRTDLGWISKKHISPVSVSVPELQPYLDKTAEMADSSSKIPQKTVQSQKNLTALQEEKEGNAVSGQKKNFPQTDETRDSISSAVRGELDAIFRHPELKTLENFIRKYKDREQYRPLVDSAREAYRKMLLDQ